LNQEEDAADDETTIEEEERQQMESMNLSESREELEQLEAEGSLPLEDLLKKYNIHQPEPASNGQAMDVDLQEEPIKQPETLPPPTDSNSEQEKAQGYFPLLDLDFLYLNFFLHLLPLFLTPA